MSDYARRVGYSAWSMFIQVWWRGLLSFGISVSLAFAFLQLGLSGYALVVVGAVAASGALLVPIGWAWLRAPSLSGLPWSQRARFIVENL